jgi:hypothetical protein
LAIERFREQPCQRAIIYYIYGLCKQW